ncbi:tetratricopeptide repeat protein [Sphaerotilus mobilis]|uniref:Tetratricopeptide repeat protein n=1 Tax=Sphaerotilus mobilis TaxID=47994 RepID=A0A4Q7LG44_9BURK|nr:tetratricopeptide repeat protein [Sphaerotilus mobilis]RZS53042.1 tetratricopeptide repeat protein [Sphaerotilus mobilis]
MTTRPRPGIRHMCLSVLSVLLLLSGACAQARGMEDLEPAPTAQSELSAARELLRQERWPAAVSELQALSRRRPDDAEVHNLLGYALRKTGALEPAFAAYRTALRLNPGHLGAHEYIGEAYLMAGRPDLARQHLDTLRGLCGVDCEAYRDLADAIGRHGR